MSRPAEIVSASPPERLRVGECLVEVPLRHVHAPGARRPVRITPKAMGVLQVLVRNAGKVVSRDALLAEVWPGTLPTDDVVTQAITQLRKAFGESRAQTRYIETIAKSGYRLLAPVVWIDEGGAPPETSPLPPPSPASPAAAGVPTTAAVPAAAPAPVRTAPRRRWLGRRAALAIIVLLALALVTVVGLWLRDRAAVEPAPEAWVPPTAPPRPYRLITSAPGFEMWPTLSPDASMVAYGATRADQRGTAIMVQTTEPTAPRLLTDPPPGAADRRPVWSPDGRQIAFERRGPGDACSVVVVAATGGAARRVAGCDPRDLISFTWTPDGRGLLFGSMHTPAGRVGLRVLDLASGDWRVLGYDTTARDLDYQPRYSPDGRWIVFVRNPQLGDLWRMPAEGGRPEPLTGQRAEIRGWDWLPGGDALVFGRRVDSETRLYRFDLRTRELRDLGIDSAQAPAIAGNVLAFVQRRPEFGLYRFERMPTRGREQASERLFASTGRDTLPAVAPDTQQLVFGSDRTGRTSLWWADLRRPGSLRMIAGFHPETRRMPEWSWDSRRVLVAGTDAGGRFGLYEITPASGQLARLPVPMRDPVQALYVPDPNRLLVGGGDGGGQTRLVLYDRTRTPWRVLRALEDVSLAKVDPLRRRVLFTRLSDDGLWQADLELDPASVRRIDVEAPARWGYRNWDIASDGRIYYLEQGADCSSSLREIGRPDPPPARCLQPDRLFATNGFSVSGRGNALYVALATEDGSDIAVMTLPPERPRGVGGWIK